MEAKQQTSDSVIQLFNPKSDLSHISEIQKKTRQSMDKPSILYTPVTRKEERLRLTRDYCMDVIQIDFVIQWIKIITIRVSRTDNGWTSNLNLILEELQKSA